MKLVLVGILSLVGTFAHAAGPKVQKTFAEKVTGGFVLVKQTHSAPEDSRRSSGYCPTEDFVVKYYPKSKAILGSECGAAVLIGDPDTPVFCQVDSNQIAKSVKLTTQDEAGKPVVLQVLGEAGMVDVNTAKSTFRAADNIRHQWNDEKFVQVSSTLRATQNGVILESVSTYSDGVLETTTCEYGRVARARAK